MESSAAQDESRRLRAHTQPLPRTLEEIVALFKRVIELPDTREIRITPTEFVVQRVVADGEPVIPSNDVQQVDVPFILERLEGGGQLSSLPFDPERHPYLSLELATRTLSAYRVKPTFIVAADGETLSSFLALDDVTPKTVFGMNVIYYENQMLEDKVLVLGGPTSLLTDVTHGIIIDIGA